MRPSRLASIFAFRLAVTLALAMATYAVLERYREPQESWASLAVTHLWHVAVLGLLLYAVLLVGFDQLVGRPLRAIHTHLYKVATGCLEILHLDARVKEIADMVGSVNLMVRRMRLGAGDADPHRTALALRDVAARLRDTAPAAAEAMVNAAAALELLAPPAGARDQAGTRDESNVDAAAPRPFRCSA
jgi:3-methyladenine DNA glycosylase/8-oxoguanine DNA glycosylase